MNTYLGKGILGDISSGSLKNLTIFMGFVKKKKKKGIIYSFYENFSYFIGYARNLWYFFFWMVHQSRYFWGYRTVWPKLCIRKSSEYPPTHTHTHTTRLGTPRCAA